MKKRLLSILLAVCMVAGLLPGFTITAMAAYSPTVKMTLDGQPMSPAAIISHHTILTGYTDGPPAKAFDFTEGPTGTFTASNITDGTYILATGTASGFTDIHLGLTNSHFLAGQTPFTISNTTSYPLTLEFYSVSYKPGTYSKETGVNWKHIAAKDRGQYTRSTYLYTRDGYKQIGWSTDPSGTTKTYNLGAVIYPTSAMTLYPAWGMLRAVTIADGAGVSSTKTSATGSVTGSITSGTSAVEGETVTITPGTPANGYKLSAVKYNDGTDHVLTKSDGKYSFTMPAAAVTISSEYVSNTFAVTYNPGTNGTGSQQTATKTGGTALTLKNAIFTREGYEQTGWAITDDGTKAYELGGSYTIDAAEDFYPVWTANSYNISYNLNGGTVSTANPVSYTVESAAIPLNTPTRSGYSFLGWTGSNGTTAQTNVSIPTGSTGNKTYTANWKADKPSAPDASIVTAKTDTSITITTQSGNEYSVDGTNWYSGTGSYILTGLAPNTAYNLVCRKAAVTTGNTSAASDASAALAVTTKNAAPAAPSCTFDSITANSVTISATTGGEYSKDGGATWQDSNLFTGLSAATKYNFAVRIKETDTTVASAASAIAALYTAAATPLTGEGYMINYSAGTIGITSGYEVSTSIDFSTLHANGDAFTPGTTYYVRKAKDTGTTPDTPASGAASFTVAAKPDAPTATAYSYNYKKEQIKFASQYEVFTATSGGIAVASEATPITPGSTLYIRVKSTTSAPTSDWTTIIVPARPTTTGLSISTSKTDTTITVAAIAGAEYSNDGGTTWQSSNAFIGLNPNTDYAINIRYAVTASNFASEPLGSVSIKTKTAPDTAPSVPSGITQTDHAITIDTIAGCQYAITTSDTVPTTWGAAEMEAGTKTFSSLSAATQYYIWVRVAETDTAAPSSAGRISVYTAAAAPGTGVGYVVNYSSETISIAGGYEVSSDSSFASDKLLSNGAAITPGTTYYVRVAANGGAPASTAVSLTLPSRPLIPAATAADETVAGKNDGRISGVTAVMEWKAASGTYTAVTADQAADGISGLQDGTYSVRYKAVSGTGFKSDEQEITIAAGHTITVTFNSQSGSAVAAITGKAYGDSITAPADPTRSGFYFAGWYKEAACKNVWTFALDSLTDHITLFAKWSAIPTYTVTGRIVDDTSLAAIEGATVRMMQGATRFGTTGVTDKYGDFAIDNIPPGTYNLVITKGTKTAIVKVKVSSGNVAIGNASLPSGNANSILVVGSDTPNVVVGGLDREAGAQLLGSGDPLADNVEVKLTVEEKDAATAANGSEVTGTVTAAGKQVGMILAIDVNKKVNGIEDTSYIQTSEPIEIIIPLPAELQGKATYAIYRYHGVAVDTITETPNADLERIVIDRTNWTIALYANKFSTYAIGYTNPASPRGGGGGTASSTTAAAIERQETVALPYYVENGKEIFIGFAMDASGTMKYIAPEGVTVLFRENPKSFNDIAGHWAKDNIDYVTERELFLGTGDGDFSPQSGMTRAMFATVIGRLYERSYDKLPGKEGRTFADVDGKAYYKTYIDWASDNNVITGIGGGLFKPDREITRQEMAAILYRFAEFLNVLPSGSDKIQLNYPDTAEIASWATEAAKYCQQTGIITGRSGGNFVPQGAATRAEVAAILQRFIESSVK